MTDWRAWIAGARRSDDPLRLRRKVRRTTQVATALTIGALSMTPFFIDKQVRTGEQHRLTVVEQRDGRTKRIDFKIIATSVFLVKASTSPWTVPADCNLIDRVDCIGAGGSGGVYVGNRNACGGGGGAWSRKNNISTTPGATFSFSIGSGGPAVSQTGTGGGTAPSPLAGNAGGDTWFSSTSVCLAKGGGAGTVTTAFGPFSGPAGGAAASGVGDSKNSGGAGGSVTAATINDATGGGGAAGPNGNGVAGADVSTSDTSGSGGAGDNGSGGAGNGLGVNGGNGTEYDASHGSGGGGGGLQTAASTTAGAGGLYGAGGGAAGTPNSGTATVTTGKGADGLIFISYTPIKVFSFNMPMLGM